VVKEKGSHKTRRRLLNVRTNHEYSRRRVKTDRKKRREDENKQEGGGVEVDEKGQVRN